MPAEVGFVSGLEGRPEDLFRRATAYRMNMKTVFITGGATGIGAASVRKFAGAGWAVSFMDINVSKGRELLEELSGFPLLFTAGNIRHREDIGRAVEETVKWFGGLDSVVANAGIHRKNTLLSISEEELDLMIDTNLKGTVNTLRIAVPHLIERGGGSVVINASDQSLIGKAESFGYGLTKGALGQMTKSLAIDLGPKGVRVNAVCPGTIRTPLAEAAIRKWAAESGRSMEECWEEEAGLFPLKKVGQAEDVAEMIFFLAGKAAGFCTGGLYPVDGGLVAG